MLPPTSTDTRDTGDTRALEAAVMGRIAAERGPVARLRSLSRPARFGLLVAVVAVCAAVFALFLLRRDLDGYPPARMAVAVGGYGGLLLAAAWLALRPLYLPDRPGARRVLLVLGLALPFVLALLPELPTARAATAALHARWATFCFLDGALVAAAILVLGRVLDRGGPGASLAALAAGLAGALMLHIHCPLNYPLHLLVGHAMVPVAALAAGALLSRRG
jgi:hypothetical protein